MISLQLFNFFLFILCLNQKFLNQYSGSFRFILLFFPFYMSFCVKLTKYYFYYVKISYNFVVRLFFPSFVPQIIPLIIFFHFCFTFVWNIYLLLVIYSSVLISLPLYCYNYYYDRKISVFPEFFVLICVYFFQIYDFEDAYSIVSFMISAQIVFLNNRLS